MFLKRELAFLAAALVIAFVARTYFPPPKKKSPVSLKAREAIALVQSVFTAKGLVELKTRFGISSGTGAPGSLVVETPPAAEAVETISEPVYADATDSPFVDPPKNSSKDLFEDSVEPSRRADGSASREPANESGDGAPGTAEVSSEVAELTGDKQGAEALLALTEKLSGEFAADKKAGVKVADQLIGKSREKTPDKPAAKAPSKSDGKMARVGSEIGERKPATPSLEEEERDFFKEEVGLSDKELHLLQEERKRLKEKLLAAEELKKTDLEKARAHKAALLKSHKAWMRQFLGLERYRLFEDFQDQQDL